MLNNALWFGAMALGEWLFHADALISPGRLSVLPYRLSAHPEKPTRPQVGPTRVQPSTGILWTLLTSDFGHRHQGRSLLLIVSSDGRGAAAAFDACQEQAKSLAEPGEEAGSNGGERETDL